MSRNTLLSAAVALGLAITASGAALAVGGHESHGASRMELRLNDGQKWQTDDALRLGMAGMRAQLAASLEQVHARAFTPSDYAALAEDLQAQIDYIVTNCKLPEEADAQLHIVLGEMLEGVNAMRSGKNPADGAERVARALEAYALHFEHPGWASLEH
jgi:phosphoglucomutase